MANAGYGNHVTTDPKVAEDARPAPAGQGGPSPAAPPRDDHAKAPVPTSDDHPDRDDRHEATPGAGALPGRNAGDDVDPGAG